MIPARRKLKGVDQMGVARKCKRCDHNWEQRTLQVEASVKPVQCPKCKSPKWDMDRKPARGAKAIKSEKKEVLAAAV
jgi:Zn finger protein HypA/HybF involved in hydrogenase expression